MGGGVVGAGDCCWQLRVRVLARPAIGITLRSSMSAVDLASLSRQIRRRQDALRELERQRNALIREAVAAGARPADLARETGLTRARITQIAQARTSTDLTTETK